MIATAPLALLALIAPALVGDRPTAEVIVRGRGTALAETPVVAAIDGRIEPGRYWLRLPGAVVAASVFRDRGASRIAAVLPSVPASGEVVYGLTPVGEQSKTHPGIELIDRPDEVEVRLHARPFLTYHARGAPKPYYSPVYGPTGREVTRAYPMREVRGEKRDHPHQRSLWLTHGKVNGIDFWSELAGHGAIVETSRAIVSSGPILGEIRTTDDWRGPDGEVVCTDERIVRVFDTEGPRLIDFEATIRASHGPVTFGDTKEGTFGLRVASSMDVDARGGGRITTSAGLTDAAAWGKAADWVDYSGPVGDATLGVAVLDHPTSFRHPTTWHVRPYGLFAANPFGWRDFGRATGGEFTLPKGESIRLAYRLVIHQGNAATASIGTAYAAFAGPPEVVIRVSD